MVLKAPATTKGRQTRQALVEAAFELLNQPGIVDVRVTDISLGAGLSPAAFYRYFDTKEEVLAEVIELFTTRVTDAMRAPDEAERLLPPFERFARVNRRYVSAYSQFGQILRIIDQLIVSDPAIALTRRNLQHTTVPRLASTFRRLADAGEIRTDVDLDLAAVALSTMLQRLSFVMLVLEGRSEMHPRLLETVDLIWANALGLRPSDASFGVDGDDDVRAWVAGTHPRQLTYISSLFELPPAASSKGELTRQRLLRAARAVFERDGYLAARVADITATAGVSHGTFYSYFDSRLDVFRLLVAKLHDELIQAMREAASEAAASHFVRMRNANRVYFEFYRSNARLIAVLEQMSTIDDECARVRLGLRDWFVGRNERHIRTLQAEELADPRLDPFSTGQALVSMVERMSFNWFVLGVTPPPDAADRLSLVWARAVGMPVRDVRR